MENNGGNYWRCSDNIEDIEADQPYGILSIVEYGMSEPDTSETEKMIRLQSGYGRGISTRAAYSELAADVRQYNPNHSRMGQLLTTDDILQLNLHDEDKDDTLPETTAMLRSVGINKYDDSTFSSYNKNEESNKILSKPVINGKSYPILLDDSYHKFVRKPRTPKIPEVNNENNSNEDNSNAGNCSSKIENNTKESPNSSSNNIADRSIIGFASVLMPNDNEKHTQRHRQPTIGIDKEIFVKPIEVYFSQKTKQSKKKKLAKDNLVNNM